MSPDAPCHAVPLDGALTIATIAAAAVRVREALATGASPVFDLSGITHVDGAGLQLLMLAAREARAAGGAVTLHAPSRAVQAALATARLGHDLLPEPTA
jgi:anti-sigma B factor antagonist